MELVIKQAQQAAEEFLDKLNQLQDRLPKHMNFEMPEVLETQSFDTGKKKFYLARVEVSIIPAFGEKT